MWHRKPERERESERERERIAQGGDTRPSSQVAPQASKQARETCRAPGNTEASEAAPSVAPKQGGKCHLCGHSDHRRRCTTIHWLPSPSKGCTSRPENEMLHQNGVEPHVVLRGHQGRFDKILETSSCNIQGKAGSIERLIENAESNTRSTWRIMGLSN